jgi:hypothetical protein
VLASSAQAVVYATGATAYRCVPGSKPARIGALDCQPGGTGHGTFRLADTILAYAETECGVDTSSADVVVFDLRSDRTLLSAPAFSGPRLPEGFSDVPGLVLRGSGSAGWLGSEGSPATNTTSYEVHSAAAGRTRLLDRGPQIDPRSLSLNGSCMQWRNGGRTRTATLR